MVVKVETRDGWQYYGNVARVNVVPKKIQTENTGIGFPDGAESILVHHVKDKGNNYVFSPKSKEAVSSDMQGVGKLIIEREDGTSKTYMFDGKVFIMSDSGKTIERI